MLIFPQLQNTEKDNVVISFSAGRSSAFMCQMMLSDPYWSKKNLLFIFANTSKEREETLMFCHRCDERIISNGLVWVEAKVNPEDGEGTKHTLTNFHMAKRNGEVFEAVIKKYGIPNSQFPHCTRELKDRPINSFAKQHFNGEPYVTALGMRFDEISRVKQSDKFIYPLAANGILVGDVRRFWNKQDFDLRLKDYEGNCDLCWKKSKRKILTLIRENPAIVDWWSDMEAKYSNADIHGNGVTANFNRKNETIPSLVEQSKGAFIPVTDPFWINNKNSEMDDEQSCACANSNEFGQEEMFG
jgi:hypothetical protein